MDLIIAHAINLIEHYLVFMEIRGFTIAAKSVDDEN